MIKLKKIDKPTKIYNDVIEDGALDQFISAMELPFVTRGAMMPDAHQGYSLPIGGVVETDSIILPSWVGYDIGCGMCAMNTTFDLEDIVRNRQQIFKAIYKKIPVGFCKRSKSNPHYMVKDIFHQKMDLSSEGYFVYNKKNGDLQIGTLGGGNHFIEIGCNYDNHTIVIIIHSGSRGVGHGIAQHYMKLASPNGNASEGHYGFDVNSEEGKNYINDMNFCLDFALMNRKAMMNDVADAIREICPGELTGEIINRNHNHAESKDDRYWIHRKGATHAEYGMYGVIPGNMRDGSFIVVGKGNEESLCSSSHGAGRVLGRKEAKRKLDLEDFQMTMEGVTAKVDAGTLDESPFAYKDIFRVMDLQEDLVEVVAHIEPLINIKG